MKFSLAFNVLHHNWGWKSCKACTTKGSLKWAELSLNTPSNSLHLLSMKWDTCFMQLFVFSASWTEWWRNMQVRLSILHFIWSYLGTVRGGENMVNAITQFSLRFLVNQQNLYMQSLILSLRLVPAGRKAIQVNKTSLKHTMLREGKAAHPLRLQWQTFQ